MWVLKLAHVPHRREDAAHGHNVEIEVLTGTDHVVYLFHLRLRVTASLLPRFRSFLSSSLHHIWNVDPRKLAKVVGNVLASAGRLCKDIVFVLLGVGTLVLAHVEERFDALVLHDDTALDRLRSLTRRKSCFIRTLPRLRCVPPTLSRSLPLIYLRRSPTMHPRMPEKRPLRREC